MKVVVYCPCRRRVRLVPGVLSVREQTGKAAPTPEHAGLREGRKLLVFKLTYSQEATLSVAFLDGKGNPAETDGPPEWLVSNPNVLALEPAADGLSCVCSAVGPLGQATVSVKADADLGAGRKEVVGLLDVTVTAGTAVTVVITPSAPVEQPDGPTPVRKSSRRKKTPPHQ